MAFNLNTTLAGIGSALSKAAATPGAPASVVKALDDLNTAIDSIEAAVPDLARTVAVDGINLGLEKLGLSALEPEIDALAGPAITAVENLVLNKLGLTVLAQKTGVDPLPSNNAEQIAAARELASGQA